MLSVEPEVHDHIVDFQDAVELPTSIPNVEPIVHEQREEEEDGNDPKGKEEVKSNSEDIERESAEKMVFAAQLQNEILIMIQVKLRTMLPVFIVKK